MDPVAVVGFSFKLPQDAVDESSFWDVLQDRRSLMTTWPEDRGCVDSFHDNGSKKLNTLHGRGAHFVKEDPAVFDAPFFSITSKEAASMDPQQRWVLETAYHAFENAGIPIESLKGSRTAVFGCSMSDDYSRISGKDPDAAPRMAATGIAPSILSNRVSWYFHLRGPSMQIETACSSSMIGLDQACQSIRNGDATAALVFGCNVLLSPESSLFLSNMNFLSPDSLCYSFDHRANGYSRGEGIVAIVIKPLADAVRDGDVIRAVIRGTGSNQDGRTPTMTQPSAEAQEILIRHVYQKAGLSLDDTRYVEAHGTGTPTGDPIEMRAIGRIFRTHRSKDSPLFVGSVKSNLGHLEGASGLAGIVKTILALEKGAIPPNALFEKMNPDIDAEFYNVEVPTKKTVWPTTGLRRASVNSFGFGGSNAHVILDDALHYLQSRGLVGHHNCTVFSSSSGSPAVNGTTYSTGELVMNKDFAGYETSRSGQSFSPRLLVWTAADSDALDRVLRSYQPFCKAHISGSPRKLDQLSYTLARRRTHLPWRAFSIVDAASAEDGQMPMPRDKPVRASSASLGIAFVFTGQGAQYARMGLDLLRYPVFAETLRRADAVLTGLGCHWSLFDALNDQERINRPEFSQPLCTALQLALVELLKTFNIVPAAVVGHSSGEIAAAYAIGALSFEAACKVAYYRGQVVCKLKAASSSTPGAMMSVNLADSEVRSYMTKIGNINPETVHVACINSPLNCTLSASEEVIDEIKRHLDADGIFAAKLKSGVAYHSPAMESVAAEYEHLLASLASGPLQRRVSMISSITGQIVTPKLLSSAKYWVDNLVSPVRFADALDNLAKGAALKVGVANITDVIEIGPHAALRRPVLDTLAKAHEGKTAANESTMRYHSSLQRSKSALSTVLALLGSLFCHGHSVSIAAGNGHDTGTTPPPLVDCPKYPFDHSRRYWTESRLSKDFRLRRHHAGHLLGKPASDWNPLRPSFRNWLSIEAIPWLADHTISDTIIAPGAGSVVMAIEAVRHLYTGSLPVSGYIIKEAHFVQPIPVAREVHTATETALYVRPLRQQNEKEATCFEIGIFAYKGERWTECFRADVQIQFEEKIEPQVDRGLEKQAEWERILGLSKKSQGSCSDGIDSGAFYRFLRGHGLDYGPAFSLLQDVHWNRDDMSTARIEANPSVHQAGESPVHPAVLDAAVHLILAQVSEGMSGPMPTLVPQRLSNAWISAKAWALSGPSVRLTSVVRENTILGIKGSVYAVAEDGSALCAIENMEMVPVSQNAAPEERHDSDLLYTIEWKPDISALGSGDLQTLCDAEPVGEGRCTPAEYEKLDLAISKAAVHALQAVSDAGVDLSTLPSHLQRFAAMLKHRYGGEERLSKGSREDIMALLEECEATQPAWKLFTDVGRHLEYILRGETNPLDLFFASSSATAAFYASVFDELCDARFKAFIDLASHQNPGLRILEVGAGTGGMTRHVLAALKAFEQRTGASRFSEYTYTDLSPAFFEESRIELAEFSERMVYKKLDIEKDPRDEGFECAAYDMVIAGSVLHATSDLSKTLAHCRSLLKPGGHLISLEITAPDSAWANVGFGSLPGWWLAVEDWRQNGPLVTEEQWHALAQETGFSGLDLSLGYDTCVKLMVATAVEEASTPDADRLVLLDYQCRVVHLDEADHTTWAPDEVVVSLLEVDAPRLATLGEQEFLTLQRLMQRTQHLLWVVAPSPDARETSPHYGVALGFLRTIISEEPSKHIVSLSIGFNERGFKWTPRVYTGYVEKLLRKCFVAEKPSPEVEFVVRGGHLNIGRLSHEARIEDDRKSRVKPSLRNESWESEQALMLSVGTAGMLDTLRFVEDPQQEEALGPEEVEIEAKAWPVSFRDLFIALGRLSEQDLGYECAGVVSRAGSRAGFQPGDRVCMFVLGCMRSHPRTTADNVYRIPDSLSFEEAGAAFNPGMTAYHALVNVARIQAGEKVLIHSAAGSTGQMALWIAKRAGAEIFATVGYDDKKQLLMDVFGIPADHIFYSRNTSFARGIKRMTGGYGVDVVLNSLSGEGLRASWECIAPYGRFLEIGKMDIGSNASLPMGSFAKNVSFCAIDLHHIIEGNARLTSSLIRAVMDMLAKGEAASPAPLHPFPVSQVEQAFRFMQSGKNTGRIILTASPGDVVPKFVRKKSSWTFDADASYLVAGGFGGLGRAILRWMAKKGARNLIVPSRSGPSSQAAKDLIMELEGGGARVVALPCNVGSATDLEALLRRCADMPPIRGCINSAMSLNDAVYEGMTHAQWEATIRSKVDSSWNLHEQLPASLDFFVLLASLSGIYGSLAQSNYAAGCTFQDALARHRARLGRGGTSVSLDLGWMRDIGIVSEREDYQRNRGHARDMNPVDGADLLALLEHYCDPGLRRGLGGEDDSQLLVGAVTPLDLARAETPQTATAAGFEARPLFAGFAVAAAAVTSGRSGRKRPAHDEQQPSEDNASALFRQAGGPKERAAVVVGALARRLARALSISPGDVDAMRPLSDYGVDSLMAVELRNWIKRDFEAAVAVFDIMGGNISIGAVGALVVDRAKDA
ncbi:Lovastatin nonaketide synthase [Escovopsis weberi]|uniref:Lovastatin nonaketide synthase n=1 Tax=Escovopsis weberi TaxID=150374 RepID=A0A0M9VWM5_ESCWE|nr:Lovastatin nonaketide synthase [Escovopsis weberi]